MGEKRLTPKQTAAFWRAFAAAKANVQPQDAEAWRHEIILAETGKRSLKDLTRTGEFEAVMRRLWEEAGNWEMAVKFGGAAPAARWGYIIKAAAAQVIQLMGGDGSQQGFAAEYIVGVLKQSRLVNGACADLSCFWLDVSIGCCLKVFQMLDTHRRRLLKARGFAPGAFAPNLRYSYSADGSLCQHRVPANFYADAGGTGPYVEVRG